MWNISADEQTIKKTIASLQKRGINAVFVQTKDQAKQTVSGLIPKGAEVMTMTSVTLEESGIASVLNNAAEYKPSRDKLYSMDKSTQWKEMNTLGAVSEWSVGSVHAVTENGEIVIASNTGSQLPAYAYSSPHVVFVVGAQKIVKDLDSAMKRIYEYVLPLESERAHKAYGVEGSNVSKILIINKEVVPGRITVVFIKEAVGF